MIEILKEILITQLSNEVDEYNNRLNELKKMEAIILNDHSEDDYVLKVKKIKAKYKLKRFFNSKIQKKYNAELANIDIEYANNLKQFNEFYIKYQDLKDSLARWNIYKVKNELEHIPNYVTLKDFKLNSFEVEELLKKANVYDKLTTNEIDEINKLSKKELR